MAIKPLVISSDRITKRESESFKKYLTEVDRIERLTTDEEYEIAVKSFNGDLKAREELIRKNLRFVISVAKQYINNGVRLEDLVNEGNYGLIKAAERFDPSTGFKFITYAVWWIRRCIMEYLTKNSRPIRLPSNKAANLTKLDKLVSNIEQKLERPVDKDDLINELGDEFTEKEINFYWNFETDNIMSLDKTFGEDSDGEMKDNIESNLFPKADHLVKETDSEFAVNTLLKLLKTDMQRKVVTMLFGLDGTEPLQLKEVAEELKVSRERIRQIKDQSFRILRHKIHSEKLGYLFH
jgi:RNA polymerase primary sigma factor